MEILNALKQLRDDIKTWVTNNLNALNAKIDEKTIPIDSELSSTSTNPVQNQAISKEIDSINDRVGDTPVATQISRAINAQEHFSGDYNDLTNAPNITEDGSGNMIIADESGNIIFKADADGMHTTAVSINGEAAATEKYVDEAIAGIDIPEVDFTGYATEEYVNNKVIDLVDSAPEALNTLGELATAINNHEDAYDALLETVGSKATKEELEATKTELSESIVAESDEWKVVDESGNIIFSVDADGAHTTNLTLDGVNAATETFVINKIAEAKLEGEDIDLSGYATKDDIKDFITEVPSEYVTEEELNNKGYLTTIPSEYVTESELEAKGYLTEHQDITGKSDVGHKHVIDDITNLPDYATETYVDNMRTELSESIVSEQEEWTIVDNQGNIVATVSSNGFETTLVTAQSIVVNGIDVESALNNQSTPVEITPITDDEIDEICSGTLTTFLDSIASEEVGF